MKNMSITFLLAGAVMGLLLVFTVNQARTNLNRSLKTR